MSERKSVLMKKINTRPTTRKLTWMRAIGRCKKGPGSCEQIETGMELAHGRCRLNGTLGRGLTGRGDEGVREGG